MINAMTVDVEDYFHVSAFSRVIKKTDWAAYPSRVVENTERLLELFEEKGVVATFFILGWVAERYPELVKKIALKGHEVASHGYSHDVIYNQSEKEFRDETLRSKRILEDLIHSPIEGYRAASYSITRKSLWALDILFELGFKWDSSIFPVIHDKYGIAGSPKSPYKILTSKGYEIIEFPLTTATVLGFPVPAAGGGYFRQYPYMLSRWLFNKASNETKTPSVFYLHPWEVDPYQPRISGASWLSKYRHYTNLSRCLKRLERLVDDFQFTTLGNVLSISKPELKYSF